MEDKDLVSKNDSIPPKNEEKVVDTLSKFNKFEGIKEEIIESLASSVYQSESLLQEAIDYCFKKGHQETSMEEYVRKHFSYLITRFPEINDKYMTAVKERTNKLKKLRRKANRSK